jgi:hypothetical protein
MIMRVIVAVLMWNARRMCMAVYDVRGDAHGILRVDADAALCVLKKPPMVIGGRGDEHFENHLPEKFGRPARRFCGPSALRSRRACSPR